MIRVGGFTRRDGTTGGVIFTHGSQMPAALVAGQIGLKPGVSRTTVAPFVPVSGVTYQDLTITGQMIVDVQCWFVNCQFLGDNANGGVLEANFYTGDQSAAGTTLVTLTNCQLDGQNNSDMGLRGYNVTVNRCEFRRSLKDAHINDYITMIECIGQEHWHKNAGDHRESVLRNGGSSMLMQRCYWVMEAGDGSDSQYVSSSVSAYQQPGSNGWTIQDCYIDGGGGGYALYGGGSDPALTTNTKVTGNIFGRSVNRYSGYAAAVEQAWLGTPGYLFSGNRWGPLGVAPGTDPAEGTLLSGQT